jgi:NTP pyrophosphatase (non-canonical NTP hydrolase)
MNVFEGLSEAAKEIDEWQRNHPQIGKATLGGALLKLEQEVAESCDAYGYRSEEELAVELADVFFLLVQCCHLSSTDLVGEIRRKLEINKARVWAEPAEDGTVSHKKVGTQLAKEG